METLVEARKVLSKLTKKELIGIIEAQNRDINDLDKAIKQLARFGFIMSGSFLAIVLTEVIFTILTK